MHRVSCVEAYLEAAKGEVAVFGPRGFRSRVPVASAIDFLEQGYNLYITGVEQTAPEAKELFLQLARDLGVAPWQLHLEAFAGRPGGISSRHYDHDINFQILLDGEKEWQIEENRNIVNPLSGFHPTRNADGQNVGFYDEPYAIDPEMPASFDLVRRQVLHAAAGTVLFLPRAYWHETRSITRTWAINIVIKGTTWAQALSRALQNRLHRFPEFRRYCEGLAYGGRTVGAGEAARAAEQFARLRKAATEAIAEIDREETTLALVRTVYRWSSKASNRGLLEESGNWHLEVPGLLDDPLEVDQPLVPVLDELVRLKYPFTWAQVQHLGAGVGTIALYNFLRDLEDLELLERPRDALSSGAAPTR
ncbi:MAG TPA: cupin-like domain-containing protein [Polyangiaceae bacterium]|nr:cupin-like domain-containing protein [Polyangiaceae bacterium]